jgi:Ribonuclease G/E
LNSEDDQRIRELDIRQRKERRLKANIYKMRILKMIKGSGS